jgi:hypothetical protein
MNRRIFGGSLLASTGALAVRRMCSTGCLRDRRKRRSRVAILHANSYDGPLDRTLIEGLRLFDLSLRGKTVLLKPNLVEYIPNTEVNTDPRLVGAATSAFLALGAKSVLVGEGPQVTSGTRFLFSPRANWKRNYRRGESGSWI